MSEIVRVAIVQDCPVPFDLAGTIAKVEVLTDKAAATGARLIVFPEAFVSGYPKGLDFGARVGMRSPAGRDVFRRYYDSSLVLDSEECRRIGVSSPASWRRTAARFTAPCSFSARTERCSASIAS
jgi:nitrilase